MKKIFCILALSMLCLTGCQNKTEKTMDFTKKLEAGNLKENFFEKELGKPDKDDKNEMYRFAWNNYELINSFHGLLELGYGGNNEEDGCWIPCWKWTSAGTKDSFLNLYNTLVGIYGKPSYTSNDNTKITFSFKEDTLSNGYNGYVKYCDDYGLKMSIALMYDEGSNMITVIWPSTSPIEE